jgi:hypothetical protein
MHENMITCILDLERETRVLRSDILTPYYPADAAELTRVVRSIDVHRQQADYAQHKEL